MFSTSSSSFSSGPTEKVTGITHFGGGGALVVLTVGLLVVVVGAGVVVVALTSSSIISVKFSVKSNFCYLLLEGVFLRSASG